MGGGRPVLRSIVIGVLALMALAATVVPIGIALSTQSRQTQVLVRQTQEIQALTTELGIMCAFVTLTLQYANVSPQVQHVLTLASKGCPVTPQPKGPHHGR